MSPLPVERLAGQTHKGSLSSKVDSSGGTTGQKSPGKKVDGAPLTTDALGSVVEAFAHINRSPQKGGGEGSLKRNEDVAFASPSGSSKQPQPSGVRASQSLGNRASGAAPPPVLESSKSKKLHLGTSHQNYAGVEDWLEAYELSVADLGPNFKAGKLTNDQGLDLATYSWTQQKRQEVRGAVVLFHSYTSHALWDFMRHQPAHRRVQVSVRRHSTSSSCHERQDTQTEVVDMKTWIPLYSGTPQTGLAVSSLSSLFLFHPSGRKKS